MRRVRQLCVAVVLASTIAFPTLAGDIQIPPVTSPPPPPSSMVNGVIDTTHAADEGSGEAIAPSSFGEIGLSLLQSVLALF
jgi:hypothetical protein